MALSGLPEVRVSGLVCARLELSIEDATWLGSVTLVSYVKTDANALQCVCFSRRLCSVHMRRCIRNAWR